MEQQEWFEEWFGEEYLRLYPHRDDQDAARLVRLIVRVVAPLVPTVVLDIACGPGRHARAFECLGYRTVGLDLSRTVLERARAVTGAFLIQADMRDLPIRARSVDLTVNLFTSFGYFADDLDHLRALRQMLATVRAGGWFVLDFLNAGLVKAALVAREEVELDGQGVVIERRLEDGDRFVVKTITVADGRRFRERVRLYSREELSAMILAAGGRVRHHYGGYDGDPPSDRAPRVILFAETA